ncbi:MAG: type III pantothenate kinase [Prevotella sp.]|nr:type III pantothenate kinase [Bacteroidales bacterium]
MYLLTVDIGNTNIVVGILDGTNLIKSARIGTDRRKTYFDFLLQLRQMMEVFGIGTADIVDGILSSVVPELTQQVGDAMRHLLGKDILVIGKDGVKTGLDIATDNPQATGADRIADAVGAINQYPLPIVVVDMGTATTVSVIDRDRRLVGGMIIPGARTSLASLSQRASQLPFITIEAPTCLIGRNTVDSMKSGIIYGYASMIDGLVQRIADEMGTLPTVVATGGISHLVTPFCHHKIIYDENLLLKGLYYVYLLNRPKSGKVAE